MTPEQTEWDGGLSCPFCKTAVSSTSGRTLHVKNQHADRQDEYKALLAAKAPPKVVKTKEEIRANQSRVGKSNVRRSKGHERTVAGYLTDWSGQEFRRRRVEGRDVTVIERESTADVIPVKGDVHCSIEAKCGEVQTFAALMDNPAGTKFTEWWHQACYDVSLVSKVFNRPFYPMMFFRPYLNQNWIAISHQLFWKGILSPRKELPAFAEWHKTFTEGGQYKIWFPHFLFDAYDRLGEISFNVVRTKKKANYRYVPLKLDAMVICRWKDFAANVDPQSFFLNPITPPQSYSVPVEEAGDGVQLVRREGSDPEGGAGSGDQP